MHQNQELLQKFYTCFQNKDFKGMQECYHDQIVFSDPAFPNLQGKRAKAMWNMLILGGKDLVLTFSDLKADENKGSAHWEPIYTFSVTGKKVHNMIDASFEFKDGKIIKHTDRFNLYSWAKQAFGITGLLIGWTSFFQNKVRLTASGRLENFISKNPNYL